MYQRPRLWNRPGAHFRSFEVVIGRTIFRRASTQRQRFRLIEGVRPASQHWWNWPRKGRTVDSRWCRTPRVRRDVWPLRGQVRPHPATYGYFLNTTDNCFVVRIGAGAPTPAAARTAPIGGRCVLYRPPLLPLRAPHPSHERIQIAVPPHTSPRDP
jgi:hypothetical protein